MVISSIFLGTSLSSLDYDEYGLKKNRFTNVVDQNTVYDTGLYWTGPMYKFVKMPKLVQNIEFSRDDDTDEDVVYGKTLDGLEVDVEVSFSYRLNRTQVGLLYTQYGDTYRDEIIRRSRDIARDVCSHFNGTDFIRNRTGVGISMEQQMRTALEHVYIEVVSFQLRDVTLPLAFEQALANIEIARAQYELALREQEAAIVRAQTAVINASAQANITIIQAQASADSYMITMQAQADALNITLTAEIESYYALGQALNLTSDQLLAYLWIQAIEYHDDSLLIIGMDTPILIDPEQTGG